MRAIDHRSNPIALTPYDSLVALVALILSPFSFHLINPMSEKGADSTTAPLTSSTSWKGRAAWAGLAILGTLVWYRHHPLPDQTFNQLKCPSQPDPLYPPTTWNLTDEDKVKSTKLLEEAVVSLPSTLG